jgi:uncharacterized protein YbcI
MSGTDLQLQDRHHQAIEISNHLSRTHRTYFGRGAGSVKTSIHSGHVLTVLDDIYSPLERTLIGSGDGQIVLDARLAFQKAMHDDYVSLVERVTGRKVRAFLSQNHIAPDIASELFVLEPELPDVTDNGVSTKNT